MSGTITTSVRTSSKGVWHTLFSSAIVVSGSATFKQIEQQLRKQIESAAPGFRLDLLTAEGLRQQYAKDSKLRLGDVPQSLSTGQKVTFTRTQFVSPPPGARAVRLSDDYVLNIPSLKAINIKIEMEAAIGFGCKAGFENAKDATAGLESFVRGGIRFAPLNQVFESASTATHAVAAGFLEVVPFAFAIGKFSYANRTSVEVVLFDTTKGGVGLWWEPDYGSMSFAELLAYHVIDLAVPDVSFGWSDGEWTGDPILKQPKPITLPDGTKKHPPKPAKWQRGVSVGLDDFKITPLPKGKRLSAKLSAAGSISSTWYIVPQFAVFVDFSVKGQLDFDLSIDRFDEPFNPAEPGAVAK